ncbi:unnamed protein product [Penicillium manginii]
MNMIELSADDCRRNFISRQLFYKLARDKKLSLPCYGNGPFEIWCDDFRPANILLNEKNIAGVVDWEFDQWSFPYAPPWWLFIEKPEYWSKGIEDWAQEFDRRLKTFLTAMRRCEDMDTQHSQRWLSDQTQRSWESGDILVLYAILHSFAFDAIYWQKIDRRSLGPTQTDDPNEAWKERLNLLNENKKGEMERLVTRKLDEMEDRVLRWDRDEYTEDIPSKADEKKRRKGK